MSSATVPMFDPSGVLRDIPVDKMQEAKRAGAMPGVRMQTPDGSIRFIPAAKLTEAAQHGGKILPIEQQDVQHPGFWQQTGELALSSLGNIGKAVLGGIPLQSYNALRKGLAELQSFSDTGQTTEQQHARQQAAEGHGALYQRVGTPLAEGLGADVSGMEKSAREGDVAGVGAKATVAAGQAIAPVAMGEAMRLASRQHPAIANRQAPAQAQVPLAQMRALPSGQYDMPASPVRAQAQLGPAILEGEYVDEPPVRQPLPTIRGRLKPGQYEAQASPLQPQRALPPAAQPIASQQQPTQQAAPSIQHSAPYVARQFPPDIQPEMRFENQVERRGYREALDDQGIAQMMQQDMGSTANRLHREYVERMNPSVSKGELGRRASSPAADTAGAMDDLTQILQQSVKLARAKRAGASR